MGKENLEICLIKIKVLVERGDYILRINKKRITDTTLKQLEELGYKVALIKEHYYEISWSKKIA